MRTPIMAGNWKMNKTIEEAVTLAQGIKDATSSITAAEIVVCPPFTSIAAVTNAVAGSNVNVGAQNMHWEDQGAFTGEVAPTMLAGLCSYVILGHSERRQYFGETNAIVNEKTRAALNHGLTPIICVGEDLEQNERGETAHIVGGQVRAALEGLSAEQASTVVIAYEPIWAIGTGRAAEPDAVDAIIANSIRGDISSQFDDATAQAIRVQYGGSMKPENCDAFMAQPNIDGGLVGGASLSIDSFAALVSSAANSL